ncbi:MAG: GtrA family protein [Panacibacter sp.]
MIQLHTWLKKTILQLVDFFYPPFKKIMPLQTFRYAACGGCTTALGIFLYFIAFHFIFVQPVVDLRFIALSNYIAAEYLFAIWFTFPIGFYLSRYVVFPESELRRRVQLFRYFLVVAGTIILNYLLLKLFIEVFAWYPTLSKMFAAIFVITFSYLTNRYFSFRAQQHKN